MMIDTSFFQVSGWMINKLGLKNSNEVMVYACIHSFTHAGGEFTGSLNYICEITLNSKPTVIRILKLLCDLKLIIKEQVEFNNVIFNKYRVNNSILGELQVSLPVVKKFNGGSKDSLLGVVKKFNGGSKDSLPNNTINNNIDNNINNKEHVTKSHTLCLDNLLINFNDKEKESIKKWLDYKNEQFRFIYKPTSLKTLITQLENMKKTCDIVVNINHSIINGYKGIFEPNKRTSASKSHMVETTSECFKNSSF